MDELLQELNAKQKEAAKTLAGPVLIIAGAGSGKTKALTYRVAYLIARGIPPASILAVTFTNKAAGEMKERIAALLSRAHFSIRAGGQAFIGTFHAFAASLLREEYAAAGLRRNFTIFDDDDSLALLKEVMRDLSVPAKQYPPGMIARMISGLKNDLVSPDEYAENAGDEPFPRKVASLYAEYQRRLHNANGCDFDDLIMHVVQLLQKNAITLAKYQQRFQYIHVDEFQDTNASQYLLVKLLAEKNKNIFVIGDDAQSIYSWRGADWQNIFRFEKEHPDAAVIFLEQNYRSTRTILNAANGLIAHNTRQKQKTLWTDNATGAPIPLVGTADERQEAAYVAAEIIRLIREERRALDDIAILYRTNAQSRPLEEALLERTLPYTIVGGIKFFQRKEVKDIIGFLRYLQNASDHISLKRIINLPPRGIGKAAFLAYVSGNHARLGAKERAAIEKFEALIKKLKKEMRALPASAFIKTVLKEIRYREYLDDGSDRADERWENAQELVSVAARFNSVPPGEGIEKMLEDVALVAYDDIRETGRSEKISLMTVHAAKGLEFPVVFMTGMEEGVFPHAKAFSERAALDEERRLCYVGMTRAKEKLYLSWAFRRLLLGDMQANMASRFLKEIPAHCLDVRDAPEKENEEEKEYEDDFYITP